MDIKIDRYLRLAIESELWNQLETLAQRNDVSIEDYIVRVLGHHIACARPGPSEIK